MREVALTGIAAPSGLMTFRETRPAIECKLVQMTTPRYPDDFYDQEALDYMREPYADPGEHRCYVFGEMTAVWEKR